MIRSRMYLIVELTLFALILILFANNVRGAGLSADKAQVIKHWTAQKMRQAMPRDFVMDQRGLGYMRKADGSLIPHGHQLQAQKPQPNPTGKPSGGQDDSNGPIISNMNPSAGDEITGSHTFAATVTDVSGVRSAVFSIQYPDGSTTQEFSASPAGNDVWSINLQGFTSGNWSWWVTAKDSTKRGGNASTSPAVAFSVNAGGGDPSEPSAPGVISNAMWSGGGTVQSAAGRIYFEMPANKKWKGPWNGYVCSGTVVFDDTSGRSTILTAAHCAFDDVSGAFARNVLFIPNQAGTTGSATDTNCNNDPLGCWVPSFAVVDVNWSLSVFPNNIPWDYAFYVVDDSGAHGGTATLSDSLETEAGALALSFDVPFVNDTMPGNVEGSVDFTHALGYSYSDDPNFMVCADDMTTEGDFNWWLPGCELSGGASGGPWLQPVQAGNGPVISVNSWSYNSLPGMAGPVLSGTSAECLFIMAIGSDFSAVPTSNGLAGIVQACPFD